MSTLIVQSVNGAVSVHSQEGTAWTMCHRSKEFRVNQVEDDELKAYDESVSVVTSRRETSGNNV